MEQSVPKRHGLSDARSDARVRRSREGLRQAFLALLQQRPLDEISIRDIAATAGVGYTTYFRHYPNKEALLDDLVAGEIAELTRLTWPVYDSVDSRAACLALCAHVGDRRPLWSAMLTGGAAGFVREELLRQGRATAETVKRKGPFPPDLGVALAAAVIVELLSWWLRQEEPWPAERVADILDRTVIAPALAWSPSES